MNSTTIRKWTITTAAAAAASAGLLLAGTGTAAAQTAHVHQTGTVLMAATSAQIYATSTLRDPAGDQLQITLNSGGTGSAKYQASTPGAVEKIDSLHWINADDGTGTVWVAVFLDGQPTDLHLGPKANGFLAMPATDGAYSWRMNDQDATGSLRLTGSPAQTALANADVLAG